MTLLSDVINAALRIHLILTRIRILGSTFGNNGSGSSAPPFRNIESGSSGSGSEYLFFDYDLFFLIPEINNLQHYDYGKGNRSESGSATLNKCQFYILSIYIQKCMRWSKHKFVFLQTFFLLMSNFCQNTFYLSKTSSYGTKGTIYIHSSVGVCVIIV